jgi:hypothetical protein
LILKKIPNKGWYTDQCHLYSKINQNKNINYKFPSRVGDFTNDRIDRTSWSYDVNLLKSDHYVDSHLLRPYLTYKKEIDELINLL